MNRILLLKIVKLFKPFSLFKVTFLVLRFFDFVLQGEFNQIIIEKTIERDNCFEG